MLGSVMLQRRRLKAHVFPGLPDNIRLDESEALDVIIPKHCSRMVWSMRRPATARRPLSTIG